MPSTPAVEEEPEIKDINKLRDHQRKKMQHWYKDGRFWLALQTRLDQSAILLISSKPSHALSDAYLRVAAAKEGSVVYSGTYKTDKSKKTYHLVPDPEGPPVPEDLGSVLLALGGKTVETYTWKGTALKALHDERPPNAAELARIVAALKDRDVDEQIQGDVDAWQGVLTAPGDSALKTLVTNLFVVLVHGGLLYRENNAQNQWAWWAGGMKDFPVACVLSHGGRVMIQLPSGESQDFFTWLVPRKFQSQTRPFASHGISVLKKSEAVQGRSKHLVENKGLSTAAKELLKSSKHIGINLPLFGHGKIHPFSRRLISANGEHGHLYIYYRPATKDQPGGLLIGCEGSEAGKSDQFGHAHDARALSSDISPTGGAKWRHVKKGPGSKSEANDTLFIDLSETWQDVMGKSLASGAATSVKQP